MRCIQASFTFLSVPTPTIIFSSDPVSPIPVGSDVTLTCIVELSPAVNIPVTGNVQLTDPTGSLLSTTTLLVSGSTFPSTAMISSFGSDQSGVYTCTASVSSTSQFVTQSSSRSGIVRLTGGDYYYHY